MRLEELKEAKEQKKEVMQLAKILLPVAMEKLLGPGAGAVAQAAAAAQGASGGAPGAAPPPGADQQAPQAPAAPAVDPTFAALDPIFRRIEDDPQKLRQLQEILGLDSSEVAALYRAHQRISAARRG
jgi:hypothetical protein